MALMAAGFSTFALLYCTQPLLPVFAHDFNISPAQSSLAVSLSTGILAVAIFLAGIFSDAWDRRKLMSAGLVLSSLLVLAASFAPSWHVLLLARAMQGFALGAVPAVAMAYIAEEVRPDGLGAAMGLYVGGTAIGGMLGRIITGALTDLFSWRVALAGMAVLGILAAFAFFTLLPPSRRFVPRRGLGLRHHRNALLTHLRQPALRAVFACGFLLMGSFVTIYNYAGFRLAAPPYLLNQAVIGAIFITYLLGTIASPAAGKMADKVGRARVLGMSVLLMMAGLLLTLMTPLWIVILGIAMLTFGFFAGHAVASGWVGALASQAKGVASALYLLSYYLGSSVMGSAGGHFWANDGWLGVVSMVAFLLIIALLVARWLGRVAK
jgi:YNFM family putative membrane transporter